MSASREKKARQELNESGYVDPRKAREAEEKAKERRSTRIYTAVIVAFVLLGVVLFASGRIQAGNEAKETARIGAESAVTIDGEDFSVNDVAYYYGSIYNTFANNGSSFGFDSSKSAREQQYTEGKTWHDYFLESALDYMKESVAVAHAAEAAGFDGAEQMDSAEQSNLSMVDLYASYSGATRAQYLTAMFGKYMTEEAFVRCVRRDALASAYQQSYSDSLTYSAADLQAAYDEDPDAYCSVDIEYVSFTTGLSSDATDAEKSAACIFPALGPLSKCFHTKFVTTSPIAQMPDAEYIRFNAKTAGENAKAIVKMAIENFKNRKPELVHIPHMKQKATVGYSFESIIKTLDKVTNSQVDQTGTLMPLWQCVASGVIRGAVAMVGCNNPKVRPDTAHIELMKKLIAHDVIIVASGCSAQAAARAGLMDKRAKDLCGAGLKRVCELADIPPVLHMGSCVDISRMMVLVAELAKIGNVNISQLPVVGCAPEWMSEKAVSIGNYVVATGIDTYLGVEPYVSGSTEVTGLLTNGVRDWVEAAYTVEKDIDKLGDAMLARIEEKRAALGV